MATIVVKDSDFDQSVLKSALPVVVDFWAEWCTPCKLSEPVLEELSESYKGKIVIAKLNVEESPQNPQKYSVSSIPTVILFKGGQELGRQVGFAGKQAFEDLIKKGI